MSVLLEEAGPLHRRLWMVCTRCCMDSDHHDFRAWIDLSDRASANPARTANPTLERGRRITSRYGCGECSVSGRFDILYPLGAGLFQCFTCRNEGIEQSFIPESGFAAFRDTLLHSGHKRDENWKR